MIELAVDKSDYRRHGQPITCAEFKSGVLKESAIAVSIPLLKRTRFETRGIRMPRGKKSAALPLALRTQNPRALESLGGAAVEQVSDVRLGVSSTPPLPSARERELRLG